LGGSVVAVTATAATSGLADRAGCFPPRLDLLRAGAESLPDGRLSGFGLALLPRSATARVLAGFEAAGVALVFGAVRAGLVLPVSAPAVFVGACLAAACLPGAFVAAALVLLGLDEDAVALATVLVAGLVPVRVAGLAADPRLFPSDAAMAGLWLRESLCRSERRLDAGNSKAG
jgi:hypothetical protein